MNPWAIIPLISCVTYAILLVLVLLQARRSENRIFSVFLLAAGGWSFTSFMLTYNLSASTETLIFWNGLLFAAAAWTMFAYYHFVRAYNNKPAGIWVYLGYAIILTITVFALRGNIVKDAYIVDGYLHHDVGYSVVILAVILLPIFVSTMWMLSQRYRRSTDAVDRNRTMYLMTGLGIMAIWSATNVSVPLLALLPTDHIGVFLNALIIAYVIVRYQLLNIRFVARRGLAYFLLTICLIGIYVGSIFLGQKLFADQPTYTIIFFATAIVILLAFLTRPLRFAIQEWVDRLFYRETYEARQILLSFSTRMGNILNLNQLASEMLPAITKALHTTQAKLLFQDISSGDFTTQFIHPETEGDLGDDLRLNTDNPIIAWLEKEGSSLSLEQIDSMPEFKGLWQAEKEKLITSDSELLSPIKSRGKIIGILALGKKRRGKLYTHEDIELVMSMASQAGILIENAQLFSQAVVRANTDGLTELYNHRHFHERLEQEIARGSRFGTTFSLIILDLDLFKAYNDIYGHLAGDKVLKRIAKYIESSIRSIDLAFRYGGEEFTVILPETQLDDAYRVAERIRKTIETKTSSKAMPVTASLGIANWPVDGIMKEEIIAHADAALYRAKQSGRNKTCLSSDIVQPETPLIGVELEARPRALSIIYALAATVDAKDHYTYGHSRKVSDYSVAIADALGMPQDRVATIRAAGLLHDIGKVGIPDSILNKEGALTEEEWEPVREHPQLGVEILRHIIDLVNCLPAIMHHHEHYDGKGYPSGIKGDSIPIEARILAIADAYDAMTSPRSYREQLSSQDAINELKRCAGTQFDPELVDVFCKVIELPPSKTLEIK
jgi:diguanylate cyclase (GGDEF)-like protein